MPATFRFLSTYQTAKKYVLALKREGSFSETIINPKFLAKLVFARDAERTAGCHPVLANASTAPDSLPRSTSNA